MRPILGALVLTTCLSSSISPRSAKDQTPTRAETAQMLDKWQRQLGLDTWAIQVHLVPPMSLGSEENGDVMVADISYDQEGRTASVRIERGSRDQVEESLLHELIHLRLNAWSPPPDPLDEEQTIETIAQALVSHTPKAVK